MKKSTLKILTSTILLLMILFFGNCSSSSNQKIIIDINDKAALENYLQGKWEFNVYTANTNEKYRYRMEIVGNEMRLWFCIGDLDTEFDMSEGAKIQKFSLSSPSKDNLGYQCRYFEFVKGEYSLRRGTIEPIWIISDDHWDKPELCSGAGVRTWSRAEFISNVQPQLSVSNIEKDTHSGNSISKVHLATEVANQSADQGFSDETAPVANESSIDEIFSIVDQMPTFKGGDTEKEKYIAENLIYPIVEKETGVYGTCYLKFVVEKDGSLSNIEIIKGITNGKGCDKEALRLISNMPKWISGKRNGQSVRVSFTLPIKFVLK